MEVLYLFHRYRDDVYRLAASFTRNPREAEDVCQRVFLKLPEQEEPTPGEEKAWLMQVTANECRSLLRFRRLRGTVLPEKTVSVPGDPVDETLWLLWKLKPEYRVVLYLHYYEQYTTPEIARMLKIPTGTVTARLNRGRKRLGTLWESLKRRLPDAWERLGMPEECTRRIAWKLEDRLRERQNRRHSAVASEERAWAGWIAAAGLVCLVLVLSVGGTFLFLKASEKSVSALTPEETVGRSVSGLGGYSVPDESIGENASLKAPTVLGAAENAK